MNYMTLAVVIFCLLFTMFFSIIYAITSAERTKEKNLNLLNIFTPDEDSEENQKKQKEEKLYKIFQQYYNTKFIQANLRITYKEFKTYVYGILMIAASIFIMAFIVFSPLFALLLSTFLALVIWLTPNFVVSNKKSKRLRALNKQKSDILSIMSSCSSTQMSLDKTFKTLSERLKPPASEIFLEAYTMMSVGNTAEEVLKHLKKVFDSNDFNFLLSSYEVWIDNQGSLQDTYKIVSIAIRDKEEIDLHMDGLVSKARTSFIVVIVMSIFFVVLSYVTIGDIFIPFAKSPLGEVSIIMSFFILFGGAYLINSVKNSVKY